MPVNDVVPTATASLGGPVDQMFAEASPSPDLAAYRVALSRIITKLQAGEAGAEKSTEIPVPDRGVVETGDVGPETLPGGHRRSQPHIAICSLDSLNCVALSRAIPIDEPLSETSTSNTPTLQYSNTPILQHSQQSSETTTVVADARTTSPGIIPIGQSGSRWHAEIGPFEPALAASKALRPPPDDGKWPPQPPAGLVRALAVAREVTGGKSIPGGDLEAILPGGPLQPPRGLWRHLPPAPGIAPEPAVATDETPSAAPPQLHDASLPDIATTGLNEAPAGNGSPAVPDATPVLSFGRPPASPEQRGRETPAVAVIEPPGGCESFESCVTRPPDVGRSSSPGTAVPVVGATRPANDAQPLTNDAQPLSAVSPQNTGPSPIQTGTADADEPPRVQPANSVQRVRSVLDPALIEAENEPELKPREPQTESSLIVARCDESRPTAPSGPPARHPESTDRTEFVQRIVDAAQQSAQQNRPFRVRLHPPELGALQIEISRDDNVVSARLQVETASARNALSEHLSELRQSLTQHGVAVDRIEVHWVAVRTQGEPRQGRESDQRGEPFAEDEQGRHGHKRDGAREEQRNPGGRLRRTVKNAPLTQDEMDVQV